MKKSHLLGALCAAFFSFITMSANSALVDNGGGLIYDNVLDITWAQPDVASSWDNANTWAAGLTLGGVSGWRLPYISVAAGASPITSPVDCSTATEPECRDNELGYMYRYNLGGTPSSSLFPSLQSDNYWSGTQNNSSFAWRFNFAAGVQDVNGKVVNHLAWAVHAGDVSAVPIPAAVWLFGSGLLGLMGIAKHKKAA